MRRLLHPETPLAGGPHPLPPTNEDLIRRIEALEKKDWTPAIEEKLKALKDELRKPEAPPAPAPAPAPKKKGFFRSPFEEDKADA